MKLQRHVLPIVVFACAMLASHLSAAESKTKKREETPKSDFKTFYIYQDARSRENHYIPSGWMGDYSGIKMNEAWKDRPYSGATCLQFTYNQKGNDRWAGIYWQSPPNNWGERKSNMNIVGAKKCTFWARGEKDGIVMEKFKVGGIRGTNFTDTAEVEIGPITLKNKWEKFEIPLAGEDLSMIIGGFCWVATMDANPDGAVFYLDEIKFE